MRTIEGVRRSLVGLRADQTVHDAAVLMDNAGVGSLVVLDDDHLVGIVTDRDLVRRAIARGLSPDARIDGVMSSPVLTIQADADLHDVFAVFRSHAVRRLVVVRGAQVIGVLSTDDLLIDVAADLSDLARPITAEVLFGHRDSPVPAVS